MFDPYAKFEPQKTVFRDHDLIGVLFGAVHLDSTPTTSVIAIHCDCVKDQCKVASGSNIDTIAKTLRQMGIFVH